MSLWDEDAEAGLLLVISREPRQPVRQTRPCVGPATTGQLTAAVTLGLCAHRPLLPNTRVEGESSQEDRKWWSGPAAEGAGLRGDRGLDGGAVWF